MNPAFFGQYLLSKELISVQQLTHALETHEGLNKKLGELAIEQNLLDTEQVRAILEFQKQEDLFFGEAAQKLKHLTQEQVDALVKIQAEQHVCLGEVIVNLGYLTKERRDEALAAFIAEQNKRSATLPPFSYLEVLKKERPFIEKFTALTMRLVQRMSGVFVKFDKYDPAENTISLPSFAAEVIHVNNKGKRFIRYILLLEEEMAQLMHTKVCNRNSVNAQEVSRDESLCELLNIICCSSCNSCQNFAQLTAAVPRLISGTGSYAFDAGEKPILVSLVTPYGQIKFVLAFTWEG